MHKHFSKARPIYCKITQLRKYKSSGKNIVFTQLTLNLLAPTTVGALIKS